MNSHCVLVLLYMCACVCVLFVSMYLGHMHTRTGPQTAANKEAATAAVAAGTETAAGHGWFSAKLHRNLRLPWLTFRTAGDVRWAVGGGRILADSCELFCFEDLFGYYPRINTQLSGTPSGSLLS
uniref:HDC13908 n=1 Tax=Drosophila melanogaster TaxID=7227 RepID=Q6IK00_DROME|nr:TPA_inf: HDC13908 [Drosophila melanogaster]